VHLYKLLFLLPLLRKVILTLELNMERAITLQEKKLKAMEEIIKQESVSQFNTIRGQETLHPLVSVLDQSKSKPVPAARFYSGLYIIFLKDIKCGEISYGRNNYDYQEGTLVFISPGQVWGIEEKMKTIQPKGWALAFHPDLIRGTSLGRHIRDYNFFLYDVNEALHLSDRERQIILESFNKILYELEHAIDKHSKTLIVSNIELFLNYCVRFYDRQFITRDNIHKDLLVRFEAILDDYFQSDKPHTLGLPSVKYCAEKLFLSANYLGDLIKKETGKSAQEHIQLKLMNIAKEKMFDPGKSIGEIAYDLGFKHPGHFSRMFKNETGHTPNEYRSIN
jgi:AraC family transcriptional regulator, transcriptional activator of pobA